MNNEQVDLTLKEWDKKRTNFNQNRNKIMENVLSKIKDKEVIVFHSGNHFIIHKKLVYFASCAAMLCVGFIILFNIKNTNSPKSESILSKQDIAELKQISNEVNSLFPNGVDWINNMNNDINFKSAQVASLNTSKIIVRHIVFKKNGNKWDKVTTSDIITSPNREIAIKDDKINGYLWTCQADKNIYAIESQLSIKIGSENLKIESSIGLKAENPKEIKILNNKSEYKIYQTIVKI